VVGAIAMFLNLIKRLDFWFGIVGVIGLVFAIFTYFHTEKVGRISYSTLTQKIFDPKNLRGFRLLSPDGVSVNEPVFVTELVLWNSGDLSVSAGSDRIRDPIKVALRAGVINYFVVGATNLVKSENYNITISNDQKSAVISWQFFDPGQGIRITFVHSGGDGGSDFVVTGKFFETELRAETMLSPELYAPKYLVVVVSIVYLLIAIFLFVRGYGRVKNRAWDSLVGADRAKSITDMVGYFLFGIILLLACILQFWLVSFNYGLPPV
jgi:hypothetical protein